MAEDVMKNLFAAAKKYPVKSSKPQPPTSQASGSGGGAPPGGGSSHGSGYAGNHDCGPWIEAPQSSRVSEYRYDYGNGQLQVVWSNSRGFHGNKTIYQCGNEDDGKGGTGVYRAFAQAVSKGKYVNRVLTPDIPYWPGDDASFSAPSNPNRSTVRHKL